MPKTSKPIPLKQCDEDKRLDAGHIINHCISTAN